MFYWIVTVLTFTFCYNHISAARYPNEIEDEPLVSCESKQILIKVKTSISNPSRIYVEGYDNKEECVTTNSNHIDIPIGACGMDMKKTENPVGVSYRVCLTIQLHPFFTTERDRSYCAYCIYAESHEELVDIYLQDLSVSKAPPSELTPQFDASRKRLRCTYEIRRGSADGPPVHYAMIGEVVYHTWECNEDDFGLLVQNCYVENGENERILVIDENGCGVDQYILPTPLYSDDLKRASQETRVFKFAGQTMTKFICQIRLCNKIAGKCDSVTPPKDCPSIEERSQLAQHFGDTSELTNDTLFDDKMERLQLDGTVLEKNSKARYVRLRRHHNEAELSKDGEVYPEMDVIGMLTVLDSPEDVEFYEKKAGDGFVNMKRCLSQPFAVTLLIIIAIVLLSQLVIFLLWLFKRRLQKSQTDKPYGYN